MARLPSKDSVAIVDENPRTLFLRFTIVFGRPKEEPAFGIFRHEPEVTVET